MQTALIILAGGSSQRLDNSKNIPKQYIKIGSTNMIEFFLTESSSYNWNLIKYHHIFNKVFKNNPRFQSIVKKDEERFKKEATYDLGIYLP